MYPRQIDEHYSRRVTFPASLRPGDTADWKSTICTRVSRSYLRQDDRGKVGRRQGSLALISNERMRADAKSIAEPPIAERFSLFSYIWSLFFYSTLANESSDRGT